MCDRFPECTSVDMGNNDIGNVRFSSAAALNAIDVPSGWTVYGGDCQSDCQPVTADGPLESGQCWVKEAPAPAPSAMRAPAPAPAPAPTFESIGSGWCLSASSQNLPRIEVTALDGKDWWNDCSMCEDLCAGNSGCTAYICGAGHDGATFCSLQAISPAAVASWHDLPGGFSDDWGVGWQRNDESARYESDCGDSCLPTAVRDGAGYDCMVKVASEPPAPAPDVGASPSSACDRA